MKRKAQKMTALFMSLAWVLGLFAGMPHAAHAADLETVVCEINGTGYATVKAAVDAVEAGGTATITMTADSTETTRILVDNKAITLDVDGYTLTLDTSATASSTALVVINNGALLQVGTGKVNATGDAYGVAATSGGKLTMRGDAASALFGAYITGAGSAVDITGDVTGDLYGVYAVTGGTTAVTGSVTGGMLAVYAEGAGTVVEIAGGVTTDDMYGVYALSGAQVAVRGNVANTSTVAACAEGAGTLVEITGDVTAGSHGVYAFDGGKITVAGDVTGDNNVVWAERGGNITVVGNVVATGDSPGNGVYADNAGTKITIAGDITATSVGVVVRDGAKLTLTGSIDSGAVGAYADTGAEATINGTITSAIYISIEGGSQDIGDNVTPTTKLGYLTYTSIISPVSTVWVLDSAAFEPVTGISGVPAAATAGTPLTLTGAVTPAGATFQDIVWSVKTAGTTGASIVGNILNTTAAGTVTITATIYGGGAAMADYTQDFVITVNPALPFICQIGSTGYTSFNAAVGAAVSGQTIQMLENYTETTPIVVDGKTINLNLGNCTLRIDTAATPGSTALTVKNGGNLNLTGTGTGRCNVTGALIGVDVEGAGSAATVNHVAATEEDAVGVYVSGNGTVTVNGDITAEAEDSVGISVWYSGTATVNGDISAALQGVDWFCPTANNTLINITVNGNVTVLGICGYYNSYDDVEGVSGSAGTVHITGDVTVHGGEGRYGGGSKGVYCNTGVVTIDGNVLSDWIGAEAPNGGKVIIDGTLTAPGAPFVRVGNTQMTAVQGVFDNPYYKFTDGSAYVWAKGVSGTAAYVCQIGSTGYTSLKAAVDAADTADTITMIANSIETAPIVVDEKTITLQMGGFDVNLDTGGTPGGALTVKNGGALTQTGTGEFNITGGAYGVYAITGGKATVIGDVTSVDNVGAYAEGDGSEITVFGNVTGQMGVWAEYGGKITVSSTCDGPTVTVMGTDDYGAYAEDPGTVIEITGNVVSVHFVGACAQNEARLKITGSVTGSNVGVTAVSGSEITVINGPVKGTSDTGVIAEDAGTVVTIIGSVTGDNYGVDARNGAVVEVSGPVEGTALSGVYAAAGAKVTVTGTVAGGTNYIEMNETAKSADDHEAASTKAGYWEYRDGTACVWVSDGSALVAVTNITGVPATARAGTPLTLSGTVAPADASNKDIVWSVKTAGTTGATISGNTLSTTAAGTVVVTATIANGAAAGMPYTKDFTITVSSGGGGSTFYTVTYTANGGTGNHYRVSGIAFGGRHTVLGMAAAGISQEGYSFTGWNTKADGSGTAYAAGDGITVRGDITLYAQWSVEIGEPDTPLGNFETDAHIVYLHGFADGSVRPDNAITRAEAAVIFYRLLKNPGTAAGNRFSDVKDGAWYAQAINYLASIGILAGCPDGTFKPEVPITRAEFAVIASRFDNLAASDGNRFADVPANHWAIMQINSAYAKGWLKGYPDGTFKPDNSITRAEVVTIVNAQLGRKIDSEALSEVKSPYNDIQASHWAYPDIIEASVEHEYDRDEEGAEMWKPRQ